MFKKKTKSLTPAEALESFRRDLNNLLDKAEAQHCGRPGIIQTMSNAIDAMRYATIVGAPSSYHYNVSAPPSTSSVEKIRYFIRGH